MSDLGASSLKNKARSALCSAALEEARSIVGRPHRTLVATGTEERMTVVASTESLEGTGIEVQSLPSGSLRTLLAGSPAEMSLGDGPGRDLVFPLRVEGRLRGLLAVGGAPGLTSQEREALAALCDELAIVLESAAPVGEPHLSPEHGRLQALMRDVSEIVVGYVSPAVERVLGYSPDEYAGQSAFAYVHPSDVERVSREFFEAERSVPGSERSNEFRVRQADGSWRLMHITARNLLEDPEVRGIVVTFTDTTSRT